MNEIDELRSFRADLDTPPAGALARARFWALAGGADETGPAAGRRTAVRTFGLAAVAASVVVVLVVASLILSRGTAPAPHLPATPSAQDVIERLAQLAAAQPAGPAIGPDDVIDITAAYYSYPASLQTPGPTPWIEQRAVPIGPTVLDPTQVHTRTQLASFVAQRRADVTESGGPGPMQVTPEWVAALNPEPTALRAAFSQARLACTSQLCLFTAEANWTAFTNLGVLAANGGDALLTPRLRAGLLRMIGQIPGISAEQEVVFGHTVWALTYTYPPEGHSDQLYVDPATGHVLGRGERLLGERADLAHCPSADPVIPGASDPTAGPCAWVTYPPDSLKVIGRELVFASVVPFTPTS
jgi:hypothetical protein